MRMQSSIMTLLLSVLLLFSNHSSTQAVDPFSLLVAKAVKALDLRVQGLQKETMVLQGLQQQAELALSRQQLNLIHQWQKLLKDLYTDYFQDLQTVKPSLQKDIKVTAIIEWDRQIRHFYEKIPAAQRSQVDVWLSKRRHLLQRLSNVLQPGIAMSDAERLHQIDILYQAMKTVSDGLVSVNKQLDKQRSLEIQKKRDNQLFKKIYSIL